MSRNALIFGKGTPPAPGGPVSSAGVFNTSGLLVRTIWSAETNNPNVDNPAAAWDGTLDDGSVAPSGNYILKVVSHGITYNWDIGNGPIGNSSTGPWGTGNFNYWNPGGGWYQFAITSGGQIWTTLGYNEKYMNIAFSTKANPQSMTYMSGNTPFFGGVGMTNTINNQRDIVTDSTRVYIVFFAGGTTGTGVHAINVPANTFVDFGAAGISMGNFSAVAWDNGSNQFIAGLAVQTTGNFLFAARPQANAIWTVNKTTGVTLQTTVGVVTNPTQMVCNPTNATELWVLADGNVNCRKCHVDGSGNITLAGVTIPFTVNVINPPGNVTGAQALDISPDGTTLLVADQGTMQIHAFNTSDGSVKTAWGNSGVLGTLYGVFQHSVPDNTTFHFAAMTPFGGSSNAFVSYDPSDGSFWVGDKGNWRCLHFSSGNNPTFIEAIYARGGFYNCYNCMNDPTKFTSNWLVYTQDFTKPLQYGNGSWVLSGNFGGDFGGEYDQYTAMRHFIKASNGLYYASVASGGLKEIFEATPTGRRDTGIGVSFNTYVDYDFNLWERNQVSGGGQVTVVRNPFTGFDGSNNPTWQFPASNSSTWPTFVVSETLPPNFPNTEGDANFVYPDEVLSNGVIPMYDNSQNNFNHLGGIDSTTGKVKFNIFPVTPPNYATLSTNLFLFPESPFFDRNSGNPGGTLFAKKGENHFFTPFRGEQTAGGQCGLIYHWHESGLLLNRVGTAAPIFGMEGLVDPSGSQPPGTRTNYKGMPGLTGNAFSGGIEKDPNTNIWYLWMADEWYQGGVTRWSIHNVNTIKSVQFPITWNSASFPLPHDPTDLMFSLPYSATLVDGVGGWHRLPAMDSGSPGVDGSFAARTNVTVARRASPDLSFSYFFNTAGLNGFIYRDIPRVHTGNWRIDAVIMTLMGTVNAGFNNPTAIFIDILDNTGKKIVRAVTNRDDSVLSPLSAGALLINADPAFSPPNYGGTPITPYMNLNDFTSIAQDRTPLSFVANVVANTITVIYSKNNYTVTVSPMDAGANIAAPAKFQLTLTENIGGGSGQQGSLMALHYTES